MGAGGSNSFATQVTIEEGQPGLCAFDGVVESTHSGFSGTGYLNLDNLVGAGVEWAVNVGEAGTYTLEITYASEPAGDRPGDVLVSGEVVAAAVSFPSTSSWTNYSTVSVEVTLVAGENRIALQATDAAGLANIDSLTVRGTAIGAFDCNGVSGTGGEGTGGQGTGGDGSGGTGTTDPGGATIFNSTWWEDTSGTPIYSQGGGVLQVGDTYYWYGVHYAGAQPYIDNPQGGKNGNIGFVGVTTYSSKDLVNWTHEATDNPGNTGGWFGRLGVAYNENTEKYVLVAQTYAGDANSLYFATSDSPAGGFVFDNIQIGPPGIANGGTGDQTVFTDTDGKAYLISSSQNGRANRYISPLRESDYLAAEEAILVYRGGGREGNCMFKHEGTYYYCGSDLHGWNTSVTYCVSSQSIHGPWSEEFIMRGSEKDYSHVTQTGFFIQVYGTEQTTVIFAGDRWADFAGNGIGYNQWLPLSFEGTEPIFNSLSAWTLNATTGQWSVAPENNWVLNPTFEADRIDVTNPVGWNSNSGWNEQDGRTGRWSYNVNGSGSVSQVIEDLPDGTYDLSVWVRSGAGELYVSDYGGDPMTSAIPASGNWTQVSIEDIVVTAGQAEVGVRATGQHVSMDDFTMILSSASQ